jgi:hypothetical protein
VKDSASSISVFLPYLKRKCRFSLFVNTLG